MHCHVELILSLVERLVSSVDVFIETPWSEVTCTRLFLPAGSDIRAAPGFIWVSARSDLPVSEDEGNYELFVWIMVPLSCINCFSRDSPSKAKL